MSSTGDECYDDEDYFVAYDDDDDEYKDSKTGEMINSHLGRGSGEDASGESATFITLSVNEVFEKLQKDAEKAKEILGLSFEASLLVLRCYGWNVDDATFERYFNERHIINDELGITDDVCGSFDRSGPALVWSEEAMECPICCDNVPAGRSVALAKCRHFLCVDCLTSNLLCAAKHGHDLIDKRCPIGACRNILGLAVFELFLSSEDYDRVKRRFLNDYISTHTHMCCCPNEASCGGVICVETLQESGPAVRCFKCGLEFCFNCLQPPHAPATCEMLKRWKEMLQENEPSLALIEKTTKACPNCSVRVEKNDGCNHMKCANCKHEYCWVCLGPWSKHNAQYYMCRQIKAENNERGNFFFDIYERWNTHKESLFLEEKLLDEGSEYLRTLTDYLKKTLLLDKTLTVILDAQRILVGCRITLMYGYIAFYFAELEHTTFHFRLHQLELLTEEISRLIYTPPALLDTGNIQNYATKATHWCHVLQKEEICR